MTANARDQWIYLAQIAEQTQRFEDMLEAIDKVIQANADLNAEESKLLQVAYKNITSFRRIAWRKLQSIQRKEEQQKKNISPLLKGEKAKAEEELNKYCNKILNLIDNQLIHQASNTESKVLYYKMKGDYNRYISQYTSGNAYHTAISNAHEAYKAATGFAESDLKTTHPIRLALTLNQSQFCAADWDSSKACQLAQKAFDDAIVDIDQIEEGQYKDATTIMQLIRDNLLLWTTCGNCSEQFD